MLVLNWRRFWEFNEEGFFLNPLISALSPSLTTNNFLYFDSVALRSLIVLSAYLSLLSTLRALFASDFDIVLASLN